MSARRQLLESLGSKPAKPEKPAPSLAVPPRFVTDFDLVADYYNLKSLGQYDEAKQAARNDLENAITTYAALATEIRQERKAA